MPSCHGPLALSVYNITIIIVVKSDSQQRDLALRERLTEDSDADMKYGLEQGSEICYWLSA